MFKLGINRGRLERSWEQRVSVLFTLSSPGPELGYAPYFLWLQVCETEGPPPEPPHSDLRSTWLETSGSGPMGF